MPKLLYQGHASLRLITNNGQVIYVDPFVGKGYDLPADLILITHGHHDHAKIDLCTQKQSSTIITHKEALKDGKHNFFNINGVSIQATEACNKNHNPKECVGYIITIDGTKIYISGDTSMTDSMESLSSLNLDYALFCGDGVYNMDADEAAECAKKVNAKHNILIHTVPNATALFDKEKAEAWSAPKKTILLPAEEIII